MIFNNASRTAEAAAGLRAYGASQAEGRAVLHDPHAAGFAGSRWQRLLQRPALLRVAFAGPLRWMRPIAAQVLARSAYAESRLQAAVARGVAQYVIVGAGLDSFYWRRPDWAQVLTVFELDHPATQAMKRARCTALGLHGEPHWAAIDFAREGADAALARTAFDATRPAFFSWLGVTHYLPPAATRATLAALARSAAQGSELVFDYSLPVRQLPRADLALAAGLGLVTAVLGEPLIGGMTPEALRTLAAELGWQVLDDVAGPPAAGLSVPEVTRITHWRRL